MDTEKRQRTPLFVLIVLAVHLLVGGCCDGGKLRLPRMDGFLDGVFELSGDFDWNLAIDVDADFSFALWSGISIANAARLGIQIDLDATFEIGTISFDVDNDGFDEEVEALIVSNPQSQVQSLVLFKWSGDKYTLDDDMVYLAWVSANTVMMVTMESGSSSGAMVCEHGAVGDDETVCRACNASFACEVCDESSSLESCVSAGETVIGTGPDSDTGTDTDTGSDSDSGIDTGVDSDTGSEQTGDTESEIDVDVTIDIGLGF
ncbi:MAG: hypothetical protein JXX29_06375 [Deltaproteobacteria bacterium]|nr:hypothetical protein [Deltaproteobacteria bacterium]MBN2671277.1 hypothetical protein [Deltaproteobacteria bacterium]